MGDRRLSLRKESAILLVSDVSCPRPRCSTEMEFDLDKALEEVPIHVEDPPPSSAAQPSDRTSGELPPPPTPLDPKSACLAELPPVEPTATLEHRTKFRPKPKKRTKPSRPAVGLHQGSGPRNYTKYFILMSKMLLELNILLKVPRSARFQMFFSILDAFRVDFHH